MITVHTMVKNEEQWIWYAIQSVIDYVDEILVWDTGSTDHTVDIIKTIDSPKIKFRQYGEVDAVSFTKAHNDMLKETRPGWLLILDGDEIWPAAAIANLVYEIKTNGDKYEYFISKNYNLTGDIYHHLEEAAGKYRIGDYTGHINIRAVNSKNIPGLHFQKPHGQLGLFDQDDTLIQDRSPRKCKLLPDTYFHATHLIRSRNRNFDKQVIKRGFKYKYELGVRFPRDFTYPEVFYYPRPALVPTAWKSRSFWFTLNAFWQTPLRIIKRRLVKKNISGY